MNLRINAIPEAVAPLLPFAAEWGIGDDYERESKVGSASESELLKLVNSLHTIDVKVLFEWLEGPESYDALPSEEYVAFTCLTMAIESAKVKLKNRRVNSDNP